MILGHFLLPIGIQFVKNTFFLLRFSQRLWNIGSTSVANIGCQHRHCAFQPIQGQRWMPAQGERCWIKLFLATDNFLLLI